MQRMKHIKVNLRQCSNELLKMNLSLGIEFDSAATNVSQNFANSLSFLYLGTYSQINLSRARSNKYIFSVKLCYAHFKHSDWLLQNFNQLECSKMSRV